MDVQTRLHFGTLRAFGDPQHAGANPEWTPVRSWIHLHLDPSQHVVVRGEGVAYWYVKVIDPSQWRDEIASSQDAEAAVPKPSGNRLPKVPKARIEREFAAWRRGLGPGNEPTRTQADAWAKERKFSTGIVRPLQSAASTRGPGRPKKNAQKKSAAINSLPICTFRQVGARSLISPFVSALNRAAARGSER